MKETDNNVTTAFIVTTNSCYDITTVSETLFLVYFWFISCGVQIHINATLKVLLNDYTPLPILPAYSHA